MKLYDCTGGLILLKMKQEAEEQRVRDVKTRHRRIVDKQRQRRHRAKKKLAGVRLVFSNGLVVKPIS